MRIRMMILAVLVIALFGCNAPTPTAVPATATLVAPTRVPPPATVAAPTLAPPTAIPPTRVPPSPTAMPTLAPFSADQLWQRTQTCNCLVVYTMPEAGANIILKAIESAKKSIRFKMYLFTRDDIQNALIAASKRGIDVRVLMELNPFGSGGTNVDIFNAMKGTPIKFRWASYDFRFTHEKSMVIDDQVAFIMTHNITSSSFTANREYGILTARAEVVAEISQVYDADWEKIQPDLSNAKLVWSPINARKKWIELIDSAQTSIDLEQNSWSAPEIIERVAAAARRGVQVRAIFSPRDPIETDNDEPQRAYLRSAGGAVKYIDEPYIHAKMFLIDGKRAFIGSENVSDNSLNNNRELGIIFDQADAIAVVQRTFEYDWSIATVEPFPKSDIPLPATGVVNWKDAAKYYNRTVTVEGKVVKIYNSGRVMWLQFSEAPDLDMKAVIFPSDWGKFPQRPDLLFMGKTIRVTGLVVKYQGAPEIIVNKAEQIVAVD